MTSKISEEDLAEQKRMVDEIDSYCDHKLFLVIQSAMGFLHVLGANLDKGFCDEPDKHRLREILKTYTRMIIDGRNAIVLGKEKDDKSDV